MKVSVLIPTYNSAKYLAECLDTVLAQDFADMEIIIVDDGSTDETLKIIKDYARRDIRIQWSQNPKNLGFVPNHNFCLQQARGEYVKFVHADDKLLSNSAIRKMVAALDENPTAVLTGCQQHLTGTKSAPTIFSNQSGIYDGRRMMITCWEQNTNLIGQPILTLFRRSAAKRGFDPRFIGHLDYEMWFHLLEQGDFFYLAEILATWRVHETQQTARHEKKGLAFREHLLFAEIYFAKLWLKQAATQRMLFTQIYHLNKKYGSAASQLTTAMRSQLSSPQFAWQWLKYKVSRPIQKLKRWNPMIPKQKLSLCAASVKNIPE